MRDANSHVRYYYIITWANPVGWFTLFHTGKCAAYPRVSIQYYSVLPDMLSV